ncbi:tyrosine-protein kinase transmembrane receptor ROR1-like protein [Dinothrombium tinctorium]|uniref:Tyrosine-protein kinase transmembrane receptor ROR1-like protein n=1 Tax=Dinothrombium tinctorium TaxID=1965070 RepID=A0A443REN9_9ACAR|nr:tyrosine-protein kinase transmembrane receptor ROR1-like protein [Dinothrombium tinctorium]
MEYTIAKKHPLIGAQNILPTCEVLPSAGSKESHNCLRLGVPNIIQVAHEHTCYNDNGEQFRGTVSRTLSGHDCYPWNQQVFYKTTDYPELIGGHNFCRNPGGMEQRPWCFVREPELRKEPCDVPKCSKFTNGIELSQGLEFIRGHLKMQCANNAV